MKQSHDRVMTSFSLSSSFLLPPSSFLLPFLLSLLPPLSPLSPLSFPLVGRDIECEPCQRFFREGLTTSFMRILTDDAVSTWKPDIQVSSCSDLCTCSVSSFSILAQLHCQLTQQLHGFEGAGQVCYYKNLYSTSIMCPNFLLSCVCTSLVPRLPWNANMFRGESLVSFLHEQNRTKTERQCFACFQPSMGSTFGVYDIHPQ